MADASGGDISGTSDPRFGWHPAARVFDGAGREYRATTASGPEVIAERPGGLAVARAIAAGSFRVGGSGPAPQVGFETLTSGSSGEPKRVVRSAQSWIASFAVNGALFGIGPGVRVAVPGRLTQSLALYAALESVHLGAELHLVEDLRPDRQARILAERQIAVLYAAPAQLRLMIEAQVVWPELRLIVVGGSKLDHGLRAGLSTLAAGAELREFYGAAETSFIAISDSYTPEGSVGRPYPGVEIRMEGGEIWVRSPYLFDGYAAGEGARWRGGFLSVGEMGEMRDGWLYLRGRAGRMVTVADQNVFPEEIEAFLLGLPGVRQAAVVPETDELRGLHLVGVVQGDRAQEDAILRALRGRLGPLRAPKRLIWQEDWPILPSGKTDLRAIAEAVAR